MAAKGMLVSEVMRFVHNAANDEDRKVILKDYETPALLFILRGAFCPQIEYDVPIPAEYQPSNRPPGTDLSSLHAEARRLYVFQKDSDKITPRRKQELLVPILESVHSSEARLLVDVLKKRLHLMVKGLTPQLVQETFPGLLDWKGTPWTYAMNVELEAKVASEVEQSNPKLIARRKKDRDNKS